MLPVRRDVVVEHSTPGVLHGEIRSAEQLHRTADNAKRGLDFDRDRHQGVTIRRTETGFSRVATLYTEDFTHGQEVEGVTLMNPFLKSAK